MRHKYFDINFAICHLLRELGFHKESDMYFVKAKYKKPKALHIILNNFWHLKHNDWNETNGYVVSMGNTWKTPWGGTGIPYFSPYNKNGYLCTIPTIEQVKDFDKRLNINIDYTSKNTILASLIFYYRNKSKHNKNSFEYYLKQCNNQ